ncbi:hypothetical protein OEZ85_004153 [Tetradesmus obliquus]|uniref:Uncharacterized protein n=1 Tax=Tetradesmus obliquus TaxID=3088 RepID=A0ABY8UDV2_TETOB|nr:hypothetical protein OEZ85_004153 [Tetradesmus obliquus]
MSSEKSPARPQQLSAVVSGHKQQLGALLSERQQLLQAQAGLLRSYVMAGVPLPKGASDAGASSAERRQQLVAQLTQEEGAARAALEALKQGFPLSKAKELSDADGWLDGLAAGSDALLPAVAAAEDEALAPEEASAVLAARGAVASTDVLQVHVASAGPFSRRGTYRVTAVLYEGYQPVEGAPGQQVSASTSKRVVVPLGSSSAAPGDADAAASTGSGVANFNEGLSLKGVSLSASSTLVLELHMAKPGLAGLPTKEALVGWAALPVLSSGQVVPGQQSLPLFRLPLMLTAQRKFTYDGALLDVRLAVYRGAPGDTALGPGAAAAGPARSEVAVGQGQHEDIPGVPSEAWVRVQRGVPPADPYTPGDGLVVVVDAARFLPASVTISRVLGSVWSSSGALLAGPWEGVAQPDSDALNPRYACSATLGVQHNNTRLEDATATLMLQVQTIERTSGVLRVVGFALLGLFLDPKAGGQPVSRSIQDYVLNQGAFQVPLHAGAPSSSGPLRGTSLDDIPRLPCASLLLRILTPEMAKLARRKPAPVYAERVYDTVSRALPTPLERVLYAKVLARRPMSVRSAARLVSWLRRQPGGLSGRVSSASRRVTGGDGAAAGAAAGSGGTGGGRLLARMFGGGGDDEAAAAAAHLNTGDPAAAVELRSAELEAAQAEPLPPSDPEIIDWLSDVMEQASAAATAAPGKPGSSSSGSLSFINLNTGYEYSASLGFFVALDGAARLARLLPTAGLVSYSPPGSLYQDHPLVDDVKVTLDYDMDAPLAAPRWLDGYQQFAGVPYHPALVLLVDVRAVLPGSASSSPQGWACLPVFEPAGCFVASGTYQLPLFQGIPSHQLLAELAASCDPDAVMRGAIASGRVRPSLEASSVLLRLMCGSRQGQLEAPAWSLPLPELRLPRYVVAELGPRFVAEMRKMIRNKTYAMAKPKDLSDEQFMDQINDSLIKVAGLDAQLEGGDSGDEGEGAPEGR